MSSFKPKRSRIIDENDTIVNVDNVRKYNTRSKRKNIETVEEISDLTKSSEDENNNEEDSGEENVEEKSDEIQETIDEEMDILRNIDLGKILDILNYVKNGNLNSFQKNYVLQQLRILSHTESDTVEFFNLLDSIAYYLGTHEAYNINNYSGQENNPEKMHELAMIRTYHQHSNIDFNDILNSRLDIREKAELYDQLINLRVAVPPYCEDYYRIVNRIRQRLEDNSRLTSEQREMLRQTQTDISTYFAKIIDSKWGANEKKYLLTKYHNALNLADDDPDKRRDIGIIDYSLKVPINMSKQLTEIESDKILDRCFTYLDNHVYGMTEIKREFIIQMHNHLILPEIQAKNKIIAICGSPGIGKSTFATSISVGFGKPHHVIKMAGISDVSVLIGHLKAYIGADVGFLARALIEMGVDDGFIILDEIDKISNTRDGDDVAYVITHLLDPAFNDKIVDRYLGLPLSFKNITFVATLNDPNSLHPAIRDRMNLFILPDPTDREKPKIAGKIIIPRILKTFKFSDDEVIFTPEILHYIQQKSHISEKGTRQYERNLESIVSRLRLIKSGSESFVKTILGNDIVNIKFPITLTMKDIDFLFFEPRNFEENKVHRYIT